MYKRQAYDTHALRLRWGNAGRYTLHTPALDLTGQALTFDICDRDTKAAEKGEARALLDGQVILTDSTGREAAASIRDYAAVFPILAVRSDKLDVLFDTPSWKYAMSTVSIPVEAFAGEAGFDPAAVTARLSDVRWDGKEFTLSLLGRAFAIVHPDYAIRALDGGALPPLPSGR